jgi:hypothetical protein
MAKFIDRFPGYNVLNKMDSPSWNEQTRRVVNKRLQQIPERRFFDPEEWETLEAICSRIIPQPERQDSPVPIAPFIDSKMFENQQDGYQFADMPSMREAWKLGLKAIDEESLNRFGALFRKLSAENQDDILRSVQEGKVESAIWRQLPPARFFSSRVLSDIPSVYYAHPQAWNEIGFGGPASPRGYFRLDADRTDPWEAREVTDE